MIMMSVSGWAQDWSDLNREIVALYRSGDYDEAIRLADQALSIARDKFGMSSTEYITSLSNKGYAQSGSGNYLQALANFKLVADLTFDLYKLPHVSQIQSLNELAKTSMALGNYDSAENYLTAARSLYVTIPKQNKQHYDTSAFILMETYIDMNSVNASLHYAKGRITDAIRLLEDQVPMLKELYPDDYQTIGNYQTTINNLATYNNEIRNTEKAKQYAYEYYRLSLKSHNEQNVIYALQNLGSVYNVIERFDSTYFYWDKALQRVESGNFRDTYIHTVILNNLGTLMLQMESYDAAIEFMKESLTIQQHKEVVQPDLYKTTLFNLAESYHWAGNLETADSIYVNLIEALLDDIIHNFTYLSDDEKLAFYKNQLSFIEHYIAFAIKISGLIPLQNSDTPYIMQDIPGRLYDLQLTTKAIILNASKRMRNNILSSGDSAVIRIYTEWVDKKNDLARALNEGNLSREDLKWLKVEIEENERWLIRNSGSFRSGFQFERIHWQQIQQKLKPKEAAVEMIRLFDGLVYGALIITPETKEQPVLSLVMSRKSKHLEKQFYQNYHNAIIYQMADTLSYNTYWAPVKDSIRSHMPGGSMPERVFISNDGVYNQINLSTLRDPETGRYVLDETELVILTNTKELLLPIKSNRNTKGNGSAALFGEPQFSIQKNTSTQFVELLGTGKEVQLLDLLLTKGKWKTQSFLGQDASEKNVKNLKNQNIVHLASHGFFNPGNNSEEYSLAESMIRSGIALAGVNDTIKHEEDGLLTAFEVINLNLDSADIVVLSACETARGISNHGEGVYGLQRALRVAGAQNMIMSLWKVDDTATQELMVDFYKRWIKTNDMRKAFRDAQRNLMKTYPNPYYWGAFILAGR